MLPNWNLLRSIAESEVRAALLSLPEKLRSEAGRLPVTFEPSPNPAMIADGTEPDTLGLFVGPEFAESASGASPLPSQIILFLSNLWDFSGNDDSVYRKEIRA